MEIIYTIGAWAGFLLPFFNIPLVIRIIKRQSSDDLSMVWVVGVWVCIVLMTPAALTSEDFAFKLFGVSNITFFTSVLFFTVKYRKTGKKATERAGS